MVCSNQSSLYVKLSEQMKLTCIYLRGMEVVIVATVHRSKGIVINQQ
jgi:hypothetical protein